MRRKITFVTYDATSRPYVESYQTKLLLTSNILELTRMKLRRMPSELISVIHWQLKMKKKLIELHHQVSSSDIFEFVKKLFGELEQGSMEIAELDMNQLLIE